MQRTMTVVSLACALVVRVAWAANEPAKTVPEPAKPTSAPATHLIKYQDDKLTLHAKDLPVADLISELKTQSGAEISGETPKMDNITAEFDDLPLNEALIRLLGVQSFTLTYSESGKLKTIALKGGPGKEPPPQHEFFAPRDPDMPPDTWITVLRVFDGREGVPVDGRLKELAGKDTVNWDWLLQMAYAYDDEPAARAQALRLALKTLKEDQELQDSVVTALNQLSDKELAELVRGQCKHWSEPFLKAIARNTDNPEWRARATAVLRQLRQQAKLAPKATGG